MLENASNAKNAIMIKPGTYVEQHVKIYICIRFTGFNLKNECQNRLARWMANYAHISSGRTTHPITHTLNLSLYLSNRFRFMLVFTAAHITFKLALVFDLRWRLDFDFTLFTHPFIQAQIKENTKAPRHWPLCGEFTGDRWIPRINGQ